MARRSARVMATVLAAVVALVLVGSAFGTQSARPSCDSARSCLHAATAAPASADPCLSAPSCGGGGQLVGPITAATAPRTSLVVLAGLSLLWALRRVAEHPPATGRLTDGGLFRPPRLAV